VKSALHGFESGRIVRLPGGQYVEVHDQIEEHERWKLLDYEEHKPLPVRPNEKGKITVGRRTRSAFSNWFLEDRVSPVSERELESQKH
jgi:hypothetical protein